MPLPRLVTDRLPLVDTDLLVVPAFDGEDLAAALPEIDAAVGGDVRQALTSGEFKGRLFEFFLASVRAEAWKSGRIAIGGAGKAADFDLERLRKLATAAGLMARGKKISRVAFLQRGAIPAVAAVQ